MPRYECSLCSFEFSPDVRACPRCGSRDRRITVADEGQGTEELELDVATAIRSVQGLGRSELLALREAIREVLSTTGSLAVTEQDDSLAAEGSIGDEPVVIRASPAELEVEASVATVLVGRLQQTLPALGESLEGDVSSTAFAPVVQWLRERGYELRRNQLQILLAVVLFLLARGEPSDEPVTGMEEGEREAVVEAVVEGEACSTLEELEELVIRKVEQPTVENEGDRLPPYRPAQGPQ